MILACPASPLKKTATAIPSGHIAELAGKLDGAQAPDTALNGKVRQVIETLLSQNDVPDAQVGACTITDLFITHAESWPEGWNEQLSECFMGLRQSNDAGPFVLMRAVLDVCGYLGLGEGHPLYAPLLMAAVLGCVPSSLPFHCHHHTREVVCHAAILALTEHSITPFKDPQTSIAEVLLAACIHDFAHDGQGNRRMGKHTPMRLERLALESAEPYLKAAGLPDSSWQRIRVMVLGTDVSKDGAYAISPSEWIRFARRDLTKFGGCPDELLPLFSDDVLLVQASLMEDADLCASAGMPYEYARRMTALIAEETRVLSPTPPTLIGFIDHICHGSYITQAARRIFGNNIVKIRERAEAEAADTVYNWS